MIRHNCRTNVWSNRYRKIAVTVALTLIVLQSGCSSTSGSSSSKIHWPWTKRATVPAAPPGALPPPGDAGDPFLPSVPETGELPPPGSRSDSRKRSVLTPDATVRMGAPTPISLVSGTAFASHNNLTRAFDASDALTQNPVLATTAPRRAYQFIILHHSHTPSGNIQEIERQESQQFGWSDCGYHFVVGNGRGSADGLVQATDRWREQRHGAHITGAATSEYNLYGIGVCLIGDFNETAPTTKQIDSTRELIDSLTKAYNIPAYRVLTHSEVVEDSKHGVCPGKLFRIETVLPVQ